jgi:hypothetical protein
MTTAMDIAYRVCISFSVICTLIISDASMSAGLSYQVNVVVSGADMRPLHLKPGHA